MVDRSHLRRSKRIQRQTGRNFHFATRVLPERFRHPTYVLYAFFRIADDVVDRPDPPAPAIQRERLEEIRAAVLGERDVEEPVLEAMRSLRRRHKIPDQEINEFIAAMERDVEPIPYERFEDLEGYLRGSAVAVGFMMLTVMGATDEHAARPHAKALAEALQLTNFARDVREDIIAYDRVYLPARLLRAHGVTREQLAEGEADSGFRAVMAATLAEAEQRYRTGVRGIRCLPDDAQFAVLLAAVLYAEHHRLIRSRDYDVLSESPELSIVRRVSIAVRTWYHWRRTGDPVEVFGRVAAIPDAVSASRSSATGHQGGIPSGATCRIHSLLRTLNPFGVSE